MIDGTKVLLYNNSIKGRYYIKGGSVMKKVFFSFLGFAAMVCLICGTVFADYNNVTIYVNDKVVQSSQPGVVINDTTFVPVRIVSETLGCNVEWNEAEQCVTIIKYDYWKRQCYGWNRCSIPSS